MKPKISEVLHLAADKYLSVNGWYIDDNGEYVERYSCCAVNRAIDSFRLPYLVEVAFEKEVFTGLEKMGCCTDSSNLFRKYGDLGEGNPDVQGMRYFWLKWAALMAEEQGR